MSDLHKPDFSRLASLPTSVPDEPHLVGEAAKRAHESAEDARVQLHFQACGVPASLAEASAAGRVLSGDTYPAMEAMRDWTTRPGAVFLLLAGGVGSGKTTAAVETLRLARSQAWLMDSDGAVFSSWRFDSSKGLFVSAVDLEEKAPWSFDGDALWKRCRTVRLLVVDDLGSETQNEKSPFISAFQDLVRRRHAEELKTVITTNVDGVTFKKRYGARVLDRITERGVVHNCGNTSLREKLP